MGVGGVRVASGVSWLHDRIRADLEEREQTILETMGGGQLYHDYIMTQGRLRECRRHMDDLAEIFKDFYAADVGEDADGLEELDGE